MPARRTALCVLALCLALAPCTLAANTGGTADLPVNGDYTGVHKFAGAGDATGGNVSIDTAIPGRARGGYSASGSANNNTVTVTGGGTSTGVAGGQSGATGNANNNTVNISGGAIIGTVFGGFATGSGSANGNTVNISGGTYKNNIIGGSGNTSATGNTVNISGGDSDAGFPNVVELHGGDILGVGDAFTGNTLNMMVSPSATFIKNVQNFQYINFYYTGNANIPNLITGTGQVVVINTNANAVTFGGTITGTGAITKDGADTLTLSGANTYSGMTTVMGGELIALSSLASSSGLRLYGGSTFTVFAGDHWNGKSLTVIGSSTSANYKGNLTATGATLNFIAPWSSVNSPVPLLNVTGTADISNSTVNFGIGGIVGLRGGGASLQVGDSVTLIKSTALTSTGFVPTTFKVAQGISKVYEFDIVTTATDLQAKVGEVSQSAEAIRKSPAEGKAASVTLVTQGADLIAGKGMSSAREAARAVGVGAGGLGVAGFGAMNGGTSTYKTGSHVDVTGFSLMAGLAKRLHLTGVDALAGVFFEAGWGSYNSYNDAPNGTEIKGWGNSRYYGGGIMGRLEWTEGLVKGLYTEASVRLGGLHSDYKSDDLNPALGRASYETNATYYGAHAGLGYVWEFNEKASLDLYGKYFWTHTTGNSVRILGDPVTFDAVNSHRTRVGARFSYAINNYIAPYIGAAWEYEFNGDARSTVAGQSVAAPSLRGSTGVGELGIRWKPAANSAFSVDIGAQGYVGMRQGVAGNVSLKFEF